MERISSDEFRILQPTFPDKEITDSYYLGVANKLLDIYVGSGLFKEIPERLVKRMCLCITAYFQDVISDAGIWRSFIDACRRLYGFTVPFHHVGHEYVDYELNVEDIRFLTWYSLAMQFEDLRDIYPLDNRILDLADRWHSFLAEIYEDAPSPENFNISRGLDFYDAEDSEPIYHLSQWLFLHCYLMTPAFDLTLSQIISDPELTNSQDYSLLQERIDRAMMEEPIGPLALYLTEWLKLIISNKLPEEKFNESTAGNHPYYSDFTKVTGGKEIKYFRSYDELNDFFVNSMGWDKDTIHFPQLLQDKDFVVMVNPRRGMLIARNIAKCIADPENPIYDKEYATKYAFELFTIRGRCPADLLKYASIRNWIPDATFPNSTDHKIVTENWDFIARCFLQRYYRD